MSSSHVSRVIARRNDEAISSQRRHSNQIASLPFAMTPKGQRHRPHPVSLRGGTTKQSQPTAAPTPDCVTPFAMTPKGQRHRPVSLRGGTTKQSQASGGTQTKLPRSARNDTQADSCVIARRNDEANSGQRWHVGHNHCPFQHSSWQLTGLA